MIREAQPPLDLDVPPPRTIRRDCYEIDGRTFPPTKTRWPSVVQYSSRPLVEELPPLSHSFSLSLSGPCELQVGIPSSKQGRAILREGGSQHGKDPSLFPRREVK